jgi:YebC/PmpR family DNA-binding regulatory protein
VEDARAANMPQENVKRAIQKGTGEIPGVVIEEVTYEGYGPGGVAVFVEGTTDNRNRTSSEMRKIFDSHGGAMGGSGAVAWMFELKGYITVNKAGANEDQITELAIEAGADDIKSDDEIIEIFTAPADFEPVKAKLVGSKIPLASADVTMIPKNTVAVDGEKAQQCLALMDELDNHDDVKNAYANFDIPKEVLDKIA